MEIGNKKNRNNSVYNSNWRVYLNRKTPPRYKESGSGKQGVEELAETKRVDGTTGETVTFEGIRIIKLQQYTKDLTGMLWHSS